MKRVLPRVRLELIAYIVYLAALFVLLFVGISDLNPGHIYIGPSGEERYNCPAGEAISKDREWEATFPLKDDELWGISLRLDLSVQDQEANATRSTHEISGIEKETEEVRTIAPEEAIEVFLNGISGEIGYWYFPVGEVRPSTDLKLVFPESKQLTEGEKLTVKIKTGLEAGRAFTVLNLAPVYHRIPAEGVRAGILLIGILVLALCAAAGRGRNHPHPVRQVRQVFPWSAGSCARRGAPSVAGIS